MAHQIKKNLGATLHSDGVEFRVWAPLAKHVRVITPFLSTYDNNVIDMESENDGYWSVFVDGAEAGQNYKYQIDTGVETILRNDPRGRALTASDNGVSVVVANDFDWGDDQLRPLPREQHIIYELHVGTFNKPDASTQGTFDSALEKLDYLEDLGVTMIELMPITSMAFSHGWGYNTSDIFSIENSYGGRHGLMKFVRACHQRGIGVIADVVYNHFLSSTLWRYDGWYENDRGGIYFYNDERGDTPFGARPDYGRPEVRQFILDSIVMWFNEFHLDGLRMDSTAYMRNTRGGGDPAYDIAEAWTLLGDITRLAHKLNPDALLIAEDTSVNDYLTKPSSEGGCGFDAQWKLNFPHGIRTMLGLSTPVPTDLKAELLHHYNGDAFEAVIFSDSHDTAANGHVRLNEAAAPESGATHRARQDVLIAAAITLTAGGIPMLLQGQEFLQEGAFTDWQELEWEKTRKFAGIVQAHKDLIDLRRNRHGTTAGLLGQSTAIFHSNPEQPILGYHRWDQGGPHDDVLVIVNCSDSSFDRYAVVMPRPGEWKVRFNSSWRGYSKDFNEILLDSVIADEHGAASLPLPPRSAIILSQD